MNHTTRPLLLVTAALLAAGCGGSKGGATATSTATATPTTTQTSEASLKAAVRAAIHANVQLSTYVLWNNAIPTWATRSTRCWRSPRWNASGRQAS